MNIIKSIRPILCVFLLNYSSVFADRLSGSSLSATKTGEIILQLAIAVENPSPDDADLQIISQYGTDTRFYVLVRGWLNEYKQMIESQLSVHQSPQHRQQLEKRLAFIQKAIRRIDLE